jgi:hypothetical protein
MKYQNLICSIDETHQTFQHGAVKAVNSHITLRNWFIELKVDKFKHEHLSQLNSYVSNYRKRIEKSLKVC